MSNKGKLSPQPNFKLSPIGPGVAYGHAYAKNTSIVIAIAVANTAYEIGAGLTAGKLTDVVFGGNHYLQVKKAGSYLINYNVSMDATLSDEIESGVMVNGSEATEGGSHTSDAVLAASSNTSGSCILELVENDQVSLYVRNHTGANAITVEHVNLTIYKIPGT